MLVAVAVIISFGDCKKVETVLREGDSDLAYSQATAKPYSSQLVGCFKDDSSVPVRLLTPTLDCPALPTE